MTDIFCIDARFRGPPASGNGGYVAGLLARELGSSDCVVTLMIPPPLERELRVERGPSEAALLAGEQLVASAARAALTHDAPAPPSIGEAAEAETRFTGHRHHVFPACFVCGPDRAAGDGLRIFPGRLEEGGEGPVAATWTPDPSLADDSGWVKPEFVWAALDCPGYFAMERKSGPAVLGRISVLIHQPIRIGARIIVTGWHIESNGRKHVAGTALHGEDGLLLASATATWISIAPAEWQIK